MTSSSRHRLRTRPSFPVLSTTSFTPPPHIVIYRWLWKHILNHTICSFQYNLLNFCQIIKENLQIPNGLKWKSTIDNSNLFQSQSYFPRIITFKSFCFYFLWTSSWEYLLCLDQFYTVDPRTTKYTYMAIFFKSKYSNTWLSGIEVWIHRCGGISDLRYNYKLIIQKINHHHSPII